MANPYLQSINNRKEKKRQTNSLASARSAIQHEQQKRQNASDTYNQWLREWIHGGSPVMEERAPAIEQYASISPKAAQQVQSYLTSPTMYSPEDGDLLSANYDTTRIGVLDQELMLRDLIGKGYFDNEGNLYGGNAHLTSRDYRNNALTNLQKMLADSQAADAANVNTSALLSWKTDRDSRGKSWDEFDADDLMTFDRLVNGNERWDFNPSSQEDVDRYNALVDQWRGTDFDTLFPDAPYKSQTEDIQAKIDAITKANENEDLLATLRDEAHANPSFAELSVYSETPSDGSTGNAFVDFWTAPQRAAVGAYEDLAYFINNPMPYNQQANASEHSSAVQYYLSQGLNMMTADEVALYNYYRNDPEKLAQFMDAIGPDLMRRRAMVNDVWTKQLALNPWTAVPTAAATVLGNIGTAFMAPVQMVAEGLDLVDGGQYDPLYDLNRGVNVARGAQESKLGEIEWLNGLKVFDKNIAQLAYGGVMGAADNLGRAALGPTGALLAAAGQSASGSLYDNADRDDMSGAAKVLQAGLTAALEAGTEKIGLDALFNKGVPGAAKYVRQLIASEMGEEALAYIGDEAIEFAVSEAFGHKGEYATGADFWNGLGETLLTTALSSGLMGTPGAVSIANRNKATGKTIQENESVNQLLDLGVKMPKETQSYQDAKKIKDTIAKGGKLSLGKLGRLAESMHFDLGERNSQIVDQIVDEAIVGRMVELGDDAQVAQGSVEAIKKASRGEDLTKQERAALAESSSATQVVAELAGEASEDDGGEWTNRMQMRAMEATAGTTQKMQAVYKAATKEKRTDVAAAERGAAKLTGGKQGNKGTWTKAAVEFDGGVGDIVRFASGKDGTLDAVVKTTDGEKTVPYSSITRAEGSGVATVLEWVNKSATKLTAEEANQLLATYQAVGGDAGDLITEYSSAFDAGFYGRELPSAKRVDNAVVQQAYDAGKRMQTASDEARAQRVKAGGKRGGGTVTFLGQVSSNKQVTGMGTEAALQAATRSMTASQRSTVDGLKAIAKATGVDMVLFSSTAEGRAAGVQNGSFAAGTNTIYLDINAGVSTEGALNSAKKAGVLGYATIRTAAHELTHFIEANSADGYAALKQQAKREFEQKGKKWEDLVQGKINSSARAGERLTRQGAEAEVIADACEMMLQDASAIERIARQNPSLKDKIAGFIKNFVKKIRDALRAIGPGSAEAKALMDMRDGLMQYSEELTRLWGVALEEAVGNTSVEQQADDQGQHNAQYAIRDGLITTESTEQERFNVLQNVILKVAQLNTERLSNIDLDAYNTRKKSSVEKGIKVLASKLGITNVDLANSHIDFPFQFTNKNLGKSLHHQLDYGGTYQDYVKAMSCFNELVENAVPIETHTDKKSQTRKADTSLRQVYVLVSAFQDEGSIVPVQFEIKEFWNNENRLYLTVALTKITPEVVEAPATRKTGVTAPLFSGDTVSLRYLFSNVNSNDYKFFKYIPDGFLSDDQKAAKARAMDEQEKEYESYGKDIEDDPARSTLVSELPATRQFSGRASVEKRDDGLMAMHNLKLADMWGTISLGGFPMPSIAIVKAKHGHAMYGPYSVVFGRETIDPEIDYRNRVYGADAWTPVFPTVETELLGDAMYDVQDEIGSLAAKVDDEFHHRANTFFGNFSGEDATRYSVPDLLDKAWGNYGLMGAYLIDKGEKVTVEEMDVETNRGYNPKRAETYDKIIAIIGLDNLVNMKKHQLIDLYGDRLAEEIHVPFARLNANWKAGDRQAGLRMVELFGQAIKYEGSGRDTSVQTTKKKDYYATASALEKQIDRADFNAWMASKIQPFMGQQGIYNGKERFTSMGGRRTFKQTHMPLTAENVVKSMLTQQESAIPATDAHGLMAAAAARYGSVEEIRADSDRLGKVSDEEYRARLADADNDLRAFLNSIEAWDYDQQEEVGDLLVQAAKGKMTPSRIKTLFNRHGYSIDAATSRMAANLINKVQNIPTGYFEAKPARVVNFNEVRMVVAPMDMPDALAAKLEELGIPYTTYDGSDADRLEKANSVENAQFSQRSADEPTIREFLRDLKPTQTMTETERILLKRYQEALNTMSTAETQIAEQEAKIAGGAKGDELSKAKNRIKVLQGQSNKAFRELLAAEGDNGFARLLSTSQETVSRYLAGPNDTADAVDALEADLKDLRAQLDGLSGELTKAAEGQRAAYARGLFNRSLLENAARKLRSDYGSRMQITAIADRLALAYSEMYAGDGAEGAKKFSKAAQALATDLVRGNKFRYKSEILPLIREQIGTISLGTTDVQEIKNAGLTISQYKRAVSPYIRVSDLGSDLSSHATDATYYGSGMLASVLGDGNEGDLAMRLYNVIQEEKAKEMSAGYEGKSESELIFDAMVDIAGIALPMETSGDNAKHLRSAMLSYAGKSEDAAKKVDAALLKANNAAIRTGNVWRAAVKDANLTRKAVEYYRKLDEQRRVMELRDQKRMLTEQLKSDAAEKLKQTRQHYQEMFQRDRDRREINAEAAKKAAHIKRVVKRLNDRIMNEGDYHNVKQNLQPAVRKVVEVFAEGFGNLVFNQKSADRLLAVYRQLDSLDSAESAFYSDDVEAMLEDLARLAEDDAVRRNAPGGLMENAEMKLSIYSQAADIADNIWHMVQMADEIFVDGKRQRFADVGDNTGKALLARKDYKQLYGNAGKLQRWADEAIRVGNLTPTYFFEGLKNSGLSSLFQGIANGQTAYAQAILDGQTAMQESKKRYHYAQWANQKPVEFKTKQGHTFSLSVEQMMWAYATAKREASNELASTHHLSEGGFRFEGEQRMSESGKGKHLSAINKPHKLASEDIEAISNALTTEQKAYADEMVRYLSEDMAELGNAASMEMFGIRKYQERYYFPFKTASEQRYQRSDAGSTSATNDSRVKHSSFTHRLTRNANTTLVMGDFSAVVADHINQMATYASFMNPVESMNRVLNYKVAEDDGTEMSIRSLLERKYGAASQRYVQDFLKDINGGVQTDTRGAGFFNALIRTFKRGAVASSLSTAVQQPTAYLRAFAYLDPKYFAHLTGTGNKEAWAEAMRYSGTAVVKDMGKFDVGLGQTANEWISKADESEFGLWERAKKYLDYHDFKTMKTKWSDLLSALPGYLDRVTWTHIWKAVKAEQADLHPGMNTQSEAFLEMCGKRFDDVINHTQVYDSIIAKSSLMRSSNALHQMATAFKSEPTLTANVLYNAVTGKHSKGQKAKMITATVASNILAAAFAAAIGAWNKDEDDRSALEKYLDKFGEQAVNNLWFPNMLPYLSDISSMLDGYDVERLDMSVIADIIDYSKDFWGTVYVHEWPTWKQWEDYAGTLLNMLGVPAKNISRDIRRFRNAVTSNWDTTPTASTIGYTMLENLPYGWYDGSNKAYYARYASALVAGNKQEAYNLKDFLLTSKGVTEENFAEQTKKVLGSIFQAGGMTEEEAKSLLLANGYAADAKAAFQTVDRWKEGSEGYSPYNTLRQAFEADNETDIQKAIDELVDNGYTKDEISNYIKQQKVIREAVESGSLTPSRATYLLRKYAPYANDKDNVNKPKEWAEKE